MIIPSIRTWSIARDLGSNAVLALITISAIFLSSPFLAHAAELRPLYPEKSSFFGSSVSIFGDTALVGAYDSQVGEWNYRIGAVYIFPGLDTAMDIVYHNTGFIPADGKGSTYDGDAFGVSVDLNRDLVVIGASKHDHSGGLQAKGSIYVFRQSDNTAFELTAPDAGPLHGLGSSVSLYNNTVIAGAPGAKAGSISYAGAAYVFYDLDGAAHNGRTVKLTASDSAAEARFGHSVALYGDTAVVGAHEASNAKGAVYVYRDLGNASGDEVTENFKLMASDGGSNYHFGNAVSIDGNMAVVGAYGTNYLGPENGAVYVFRNLDQAVNGSVVYEDFRLVASDITGTKRNFGVAVELSGNTAIATALSRWEGGSGFFAGGAYIFLNLDTATNGDNITENVRLWASDNTDGFGLSASIDGDQFVIGAPGKAYTGSVSSMTTLDSGNTSRVISRITFTSKDDWIIGQATDGNSVTLGEGDAATIANGKAIFIGQEDGSDENTLILDGTLNADIIRVGAESNKGNALVINETGSASANEIFVASDNRLENNGTLEAIALTLEAGAILSGRGTFYGNLIFAEGSFFELSLDYINTPLFVEGSIHLSETFGVENILGLDSSTELGIYTLIDGGDIDFAQFNIRNWEIDNAYDLGNGKIAYFQEGSLQLVVAAIPEPGTWALMLGGAGLSLALMKGRRRQM